MADYRADEPSRAAIRWSLAGRICEMQGGSRALRDRARVVLLGHHADDSQTSPDSRWLVEPDDRGPPWRLIHAASGESHRCDSCDRLIHVLEFRAIADFLTCDGSVTTLHAAVVERNGLGVLVVGPCGSGKSTLATALWRRGWSLLGDDVAVISSTGQTVRAALRRVSLRFGSRPLVGETLWQRIAATDSYQETVEGCLFHPHEVDGTMPHRATELAAILFLARRGTATGPAELRPVDPPTALMSLAPYSNVVRRAGMGAAIEHLQPLVGHAPAHDLGRGHLSAMVAVVERLLERR